MRPSRSPIRHRGHRPVRVVVNTVRQRIEEWRTVAGRDALLVGLDGLNLMRMYEPAFWAAHVATQNATPPLMLGAIAAFFQLQHQRGMTLRCAEAGCHSLSFADDPVETLGSFGDVAAEFLSELGYYVVQPRPDYYGLGIQLYLMDGWEMADPLTLALWWLASGSAFDVGADMGTLMDSVRGFAPGVEKAITRLTLLNVMNDALCDLAATSIPEAAGLAVPADIIRYAYAQTSNPLCNTSQTEQDEVGDDDGDSYSWAMRDQLIAWSRDGAAIATAYQNWANRVKKAGAAGIVEVGHLMHAAARITKRQAEARRQREGPEPITAKEIGMLTEVPA